MQLLTHAKNQVTQTHRIFMQLLTHALSCIKSSYVNRNKSMINHVLQLVTSWNLNTTPSLQDSLLMIQLEQLHIIV
jgi:hypothetical protein